jgi:hypothetical protein
LHSESLSQSRTAHSPHFLWVVQAANNNRDGLVQY